MIHTDFLIIIIFNKLNYLISSNINSIETVNRNKPSIDELIEYVDNINYKVNDKVYSTHNH